MRIQKTMISPPDVQPQDEVFPEPAASSTFSEFKPLTESEVADLIRKSLVKSSALDPIPADLFLKCLPQLLPPLTAIINSSLTTGSVSPDLKEAYLTPIIKKHNLDPEILNNYRPISNLTYIFKLIERAVANQLSNYLATNNLMETYQSAYRKAHSTETAITCIFNDLLCSLDSCKTAYLSLLDCSAAFDLVLHPSHLTSPFKPAHRDPRYSFALVQIVS